METLHVDEHYLARLLIELLYHRSAINQATYNAILRGTKHEQQKVA